MKLHFNAQLHRKSMLWSMGGLLASQILVMLPVNNAEAHGAVGFPIARQYQCHIEQGYWNNPADVPSADCRQAIINGQQFDNPQLPFTQWNELSANPSNPNSEASVRAVVPNGLLCAGGDPQKGALDSVPTTMWRKTDVTPEKGTIQLRWDLTTPHNPAQMKIYLSKASYDPTQPLRWEDLTLIHDALAPAAASGALANGTNGNIYLIDIPIPEDRTGNAIIYSYWQRDDAGNEGFFNCSDINIIKGSTSNFPWISNSTFVTPGISPAVNDQIRFRVMGGAQGLESVDTQLLITAQNQAQGVWSQELAATLNNKYSTVVKIGVRSGDEINYNNSNTDVNRVWLRSGYSSAMSLIAGTTEPENPQAPVAHITAPTSVESNGTINFSASGSTGQSLSYQWEFLNFTPTTATSQNVTARAVTTSQALVGTAKLTVTNDKGIQNSVEKTIAISPSGETEQTYPLWDRNNVLSYTAGTTVTGLDGQVWACKPFPFSSWCAQAVHANWLDNNWPYAAGSAAAAALPEDGRAWSLVTRSHHH
ncbi:lytic polysaccharide monooxygenase [Yersinia pekkanenii]|uniref:Chitin binding domain-containing protein n=1 Tax=Yersinia pekkanenii TaxID=1288385 RepID=A0A0T9RJI6_9GAMM|nr:lytic polysaccharide monooxygenase [Yersinia pekkanenii]CNI66688.1 chitin binding domain-containing protein [Yersinia pekkanenii]CRY69550.1 chitin binding domain-containing protein [Yersinia pekkanenii]